jgi:hypothetical protein
VANVDADRPGRRQSQATVGGLGDLDVEPQAAPAERATHPHPITGLQPIAVEVDDLERNRRPPGDRVRRSATP